MKAFLDHKQALLARSQWDSSFLGKVIRELIAQRIAAAEKELCETAFGNTARDVSTTEIARLQGHREAYDDFLRCLGCYFDDANSIASASETEYTT